jgi:hypothetical protein
LSEKSESGQLPKREHIALLVMKNIGVTTLLCVEQSQRDPACTIDEASNLGSRNFISVRIKRCGNETVITIKKGRRATIVIFTHTMTRYNVDGNVSSH